MKQLDIEKNHRINHREFVAAVLDVHEIVTKSEAKLRMTFSRFDVDGCGKIAFTKLNKHVSDDDIAKLI